MREGSQGREKGGGSGEEERGLRAMRDKAEEEYKAAASREEHSSPVARIILENCGGLRTSYSRPRTVTVAVAKGIPTLSTYVRSITLRELRLPVSRPAGKL